MISANRLAPIGRWMIALIFALSVIKKLADPQASIAMIGAAGAPLPTAGYAVALAVESLGAVSLILGWRVRPGALALAVFCLAAGMLIHGHPSDPAQMTHLFKNIAIAGGLLQVAAFGAGGFSLDARAGRYVAAAPSVSAR